MLHHGIAPALRAAFGALLLGMVLTPAADAQSAAPATLPTAPGAAEGSVRGGISEAHASLPGGPGLSPLEPYLVAWLLPASGILAVAAGVYTDARVRQAGRRRR